jgi:DNA-binding CsgD family transcriptional regulator
MLDRLQRRRVVLASYGLSLAAEHKAKLGLIPGNPQLTERVLRSTVGVIWQDRQIMSEARSSTTSLRTDLTPSDDLISWACVVVGRDERRTVCLEVFARAGGVSSYPKLDDFLHQLAPHLIRAWRLGRTSRSTLLTSESVASRSESRADAAPAPDRAGLLGVARLRAEFGLTNAEGRLALRIAEGSSLASAAQAFNVKLTTIRSQLQQVFAKTGTSRQTELVAMLLSCGYGFRTPPWSSHRPMRAQVAVGG